jgi:hypothetical protein
VDEWRDEPAPRVERRQRLDQGALAAAVLADQERDARRDLEPAFGHELGDGRDRERPRVEGRRRVGILELHPLEVAAHRLGHMFRPRLSPAPKAPV